MIREESKNKRKCTWKIKTLKPGTFFLKRVLVIISHHDNVLFCYGFVILSHLKSRFKDLSTFFFKCIIFDSTQTIITSGNWQQLSFAKENRHEGMLKFEGKAFHIKIAFSCQSQGQNTVKTSKRKMFNWVQETITVKNEYTNAWSMK